MSVSQGNLDQDFSPDTPEEKAERRRPSPAVLRRTRLALIGVPAVIVAIILLVIGRNVAVELLWFGSLELTSVYLTILWTRIWLFLLGSVPYAILFAASSLLAYRLARQRWALWSQSGRVDADRRQPPPVWALGVIVGLGIVVAVFLGWRLSDQWDLFLRLAHSNEVGIADPLYGRDVSYYLFVLPVLLLLRTWLMTATLILLVAAAVVYFAWLVVPQTGGERGLILEFGRGIRAHLSVLGSLSLALLAWHQAIRLDQLVYAGRGATVGASYADVTVLAPALWVGLVIAALGAVGILAGALVRLPWVPLVVIPVWAAVWLVGQVMLPAAVHRYVVQPTELDTERPYIERNIEFTRLAYGLDKIEERDYPAQDAVTRSEAEANTATLRNVRLWDWLPSLQTYNQIQAIRIYYGFLDNDFDRYVLDGEYRQVIISPRELSPEKLPQEAQTWVNRRLKFTHGYGVVLSPVNEVTPEGLPSLYIQDVPPRGNPPVTRPEIYYGESQPRDDWVLVKTNTMEFDYPRGETNVETTYAGDSGIVSGSLWRRLLFAWYLGDLNLLISQHVEPETAILLRRNIHLRVRQLAPFLLYDLDPYIVLDDGALYWIQDAYTASGFYPYSQPALPNLNYIRNSVKIVTSAYDGSVQYYVADDSDPLVRAYAEAFPDLFQPLSAMPAGLRAHIRYPQMLFGIQAQMYRLYHMQDPQVFYNREDMLAIPTELFGDREVPVQPYYVIMRLPGQEQAEFVLILPYTPNEKPNMSNWLAARSDGDNYGKLVAYKYPKEKLIFGPIQIEARIDQDPVISQQLTLWDQSGSRVIRGNMLVIPVGQSNLYVEPIYLLAESGSIPEMKRVVLATGNTIVMEQTVDEALARLFDGPVALGEGIAPLPPAATTGGSTVVAPAPQPSAGFDRDAAMGAARSLQQRVNRLESELLALPADLQQRLGGLQNELLALQGEVIRLRQALGADREAAVAAARLVQQRANRLESELLALPADVQQRLSGVQREVLALQGEIITLRQPLERGQ